MDHGVERLIEIFRVANDDVIGSVARKIFNLKWKEGLSARNQAHKILDGLALTKKITKGKGFFAVNEYRGEFKEHDRLVTDCIAKLILLKLPITIYRETALPNGLRPDVIGLIGKDGKALSFVLECCLNETDSYFEQKVTFWKHHNPLEEVFKIPIPHFALVVYGKQHPEAMDFEKFIEEVKK